MQEEKKVKKMGNPAWIKGGPSPNPSGRKLGSKNRCTTEIRDFIQRAVSGQLDGLDEDLEKMNSFNRWVILDKLTKYFLPSITKSDIESTVNGSMKIVVSYENETPKDDDSEKI